MKQTKHKTPLRDYCVSRGITADALAAKAGVHESTARSWLNGNRKIRPVDVIERESQLGIPRAILRPDLYA